MRRVDVRTAMRGGKRDCKDESVSSCLRRVIRGRRRVYGGVWGFCAEIGGGGLVRLRWFCRCAKLSSRCKAIEMLSASTSSLPDAGVGMSSKGSRSRIMVLVADKG